LILNLLLYILLSLLPTPAEHRITFYWPGEDGWGTAVADQRLMANGPLPEESWYWPLCAVSPDLLDNYPYGTWLFIGGIGPRRVSDRTASYIKNTVDIRVPGRCMRLYKRKVWVVWRAE
jgi:hypothetical protein